MVDTYAYVTEYAPLSAGGLSPITYLLDDDTIYTLSDGNLSVVGDARSRAAGLTLYQLAQRATSGGSNAADSPFAGWADNATPSGTSGLDDGVVFDASSVLEEGRGAALTVGSQTEGADQDLITELRNQGARLWQRVGGDWLLLWAEPDGATQTIYDAFYMPATLRRPGTMSLRRIADFPGNATYPVPELGTRDLDLSTPGTGSGTSSIAAPVVSNTFVHTADFVLTLNNITLSSVGSAVYEIRIKNTDSNNHIKIEFKGDGTYRLRTSIGGVLASRIVSTCDNGQTLTIIVLGNVYELWGNDALKGSWTDTGNFFTANAAGGNISLNGIDGAIASLEARTLDGIANVSSSNHPGYGVATDVLPGPLAVNDEATREIKTWCEVTIPTIPSAGNVEYAVRYIDTNNYVYLEIDTAGDFDLREVTGGGASTSLATNAAGIGGGERLVFTDDSTGIKIYHDTTLAIDQATTLHNTATLTRVLSLGTGGQLSDAINDPQDLSSAPNTPGAANIKAAFDLMATP